MDNKLENLIASAMKHGSNVPEAKFSFSAMKLDEFDIQINNIQINKIFPKFFYNH